MAEFYNEVTVGRGGSDYPPELLKNMRPDDEVMAYIRIDGKMRGCLSKKSKDTGRVRFVAITRERVIGTIQKSVETGRFLKKFEKTGDMTINIPLVKITSLTTSSTKAEQSGCLSKKSRMEYHLSINAQGEELKIFTGYDSTVNDEFVRSFLEISDYF